MNICGRPEGVLYSARAGIREGWRELAKRPLEVVALVLCVLLGASAYAATPRRPFRFVVYGGTEGDAPGHPAIVKQIVKVRPEVVLHAGGAVGRGAKATRWKRFREVIAPILAIASFYGCPSKDEGAPLIAPRPSCPKPEVRGHRYYSFDYRGVHFVALDVNEPYDDKSAQTSSARPSATSCARPIFSGIRFSFAIGLRWSFRARAISTIGPPRTEWFT